MSATTILPQQFAGFTLLFYALLALCFSRRSRNQSPKRPPQSVKLTHLDVDLEFCTEEELRYLQACLLTSAGNPILSEAETARFFAITAELDRRQGVTR